MKLRKTSEDKGFTLVEIIIVVAVLMVIAGLGLIFGIDFYRNYIIDTERNTVLSVLQKARSRSQNNINQSAHGVCFQSNNYVVFQGDSYALRNPAYDQTIPKNPVINASGLSEVVFKQLNGDSQTVGNIILNNGRRSAIILINNEGKIDWQ
jgi:Tfp pilus assembly protein FimT